MQKQEFNTENTEQKKPDQIDGKLHWPHGHDNCLQGPRKGVNSAEYCAFTRCGCTVTIARLLWPVNDTIRLRWTTQKFQSLFLFTTKNRRLTKSCGACWTRRYAKK